MTQEEVLSRTEQDKSKRSLVGLSQEFSLGNFPNFKKMRKHKNVASLTKKTNLNPVKLRFYIFVVV